MSIRWIRVRIRIRIRNTALESRSGSEWFRIQLRQCNRIRMRIRNLYWEPGSGSRTVKKQKCIKNKDNSYSLVLDVLFRQLKTSVT
jgi:hypothetical protein